MLYLNTRFIVMTRNITRRWLLGLTAVWCWLIWGLWTTYAVDCWCVFVGFWCETSTLICDQDPDSNGVVDGNGIIEVKEWVYFNQDDFWQNDTFFPYSTLIIGTGAFQYSDRRWQNSFDNITTLIVYSGAFKNSNNWSQSANFANLSKFEIMPGAFPDVEVGWSSSASYDILTWLVFYTGSFTHIGSSFMNNASLPLLESFVISDWAFAQDTCLQGFMRGLHVPLLTRLEFPVWSLSCLWSTAFYSADFDSLTAFTFYSWTFVTVTDLFWFGIDLNSLEEFIVPEWTLKSVGVNFMDTNNLDSLTRIELWDNTMQFVGNGRFGGNDSQIVIDIYNDGQFVVWSNSLVNISAGNFPDIPWYGFCDGWSPSTYSCIGTDIVIHTGAFPEYSWSFRAWEDFSGFDRLIIWSWSMVSSRARQGFAAWADFASITDIIIGPYAFQDLGDNYQHSRLAWAQLPNVTNLHISSHSFNSLKRDFGQNSQWDSLTELVFPANSFVDVWDRFFFNAQFPVLERIEIGTSSMISVWSDWMDVNDGYPIDRQGLSDSWNLFLWSWTLQTRGSNFPALPGFWFCDQWSVDTYTCDGTTLIVHTWAYNYDIGSSFWANQDFSWVETFIVWANAFSDVKGFWWASIQRDSLHTMIIGIWAFDATTRGRCANCQFPVLTRWEMGEGAFRTITNYSRWDGIDAPVLTSLIFPAWSFEEGPSGPMLNGSNFPSLEVLTFKEWSMKGMENLEDFFKNGDLSSLESLIIPSSWDEVSGEFLYNTDLSSLKSIVLKKWAMQVVGNDWMANNSWQIQQLTSFVIEWWWSFADAGGGRFADNWSIPGLLLFHIPDDSFQTVAGNFMLHTTLPSVVDFAWFYPDPTLYGLSSRRERYPNLNTVVSTRPVFRLPWQSETLTNMEIESEWDGTVVEAISTIINFSMNTWTIQAYWLFGQPIEVSWLTQDETKESSVFYKVFDVDWFVGALNE